MRLGILFLLAVTCASAAQTPSVSLLVLNKDEGSVAIVDPTSNAVVGRVQVGEGPHEIVASSDGKLAFAGNYGGRTPGSTISVIDLVAQKEMRRVDLGSLRRPHGLAFAGGKLYFTAEVNKLIGRYDPASNNIDWLLGTGQNTTHMLLLSKDLSQIYTANIGSDSISIIDSVNNGAGWNETVVPVGKGPEGNDLSPDGKELWAAHSRDGGVSVIDVASKKVVRTLSLGTKRSNRLKFTPDGKRVLITDLEADELLVLDAPSGNVIKRIQLGRNPEGILIAPNGARAFVGVAGENKVAIVDLHALEVTGNIATGAGPDGMAWAVRK